MRALLDTNVIIHRENAFVIGSFEKYPTSKSLADLNIQSAPQSFVYLDD